MLSYVPNDPKGFSRKMTKESKISVINFFIFNSLLGPKEGEEHKRILLYYPQTQDIDKKIREVGLCEALVKFASSFTDDDVQSMHTKKTRQLFYQPEPEYWFVMTLAIPITTRVEDGKTVEEHLEESIQDPLYEAVLKQSYQMFRLFNGSVCDIMKRHAIDGLKLSLEHFFYKYIPSLHFDKCDLLDIFNGIHFLPLDKKTYLQTQSFINLLEASFPLVKYTVLLYNDQLVWSGLDQQCMRTLYQYLILTLFPSMTSQDQQSGVLDLSPSQSAEDGRFILGPSNSKEKKTMGKVPFVHIDEDEGTQRYSLLVYRALSASICMLVKNPIGSEGLKYDEIRALGKFVGPSLSTLACSIRGETSTPDLTPSSEPQFKYLYFNCMNLAQKTTIHVHGKRGSSTTGVSRDTLCLLTDLHSDLATATQVEEGETIMKTSSDQWVVGKKSDQREFYVILNQRNSTLTQINDEVKKLCATQFNSIFFLD